MMKFDAAMWFKISLLLYLSNPNKLIGVDLSAWTPAFAPSLLSNPPRVFNSSLPSQDTATIA
jgi:hypothetical protein